MQQGMNKTKLDAVKACVRVVIVCAHILNNQRHSPYTLQVIAWTVRTIAVHL